MKQWSAWYDYVLPDVAGCLPEMADIAIRLAASEYFRRSLTWRERLAIVPLWAGQSDYDYCTDDGVEVVKLLSAQFSGQSLQLLTSDEAALEMDRVGLPRSIASLSGVEYRVFPTPSADDSNGVICDVALTVNHEAIGIPDSLFGLHFEAIAAGALARLCLSAGKPYSNPDMGMLKQQVFNASIDNASARMFKGYARTAPRVPAFFF